MERLEQPQQKRGLHSSALRTWGMLFVVLSVASKLLLRKAFPSIGQMTGQTLLEALSQPGNSMMMLTAFIVMQAVASCAIPIFAFLTVEGFAHTASRKKYILRVILLAIACEPLYNLAVSGSLLDLGSRNPAFAVAFGLVMLYFYKRYPKTLVKLAVTAAAILWCSILGVEHGAFFVFLVAVLSWAQQRQNWRTLIGCGAAAMGVLFSPYYLASPMGLLAVHFYNGERGESSKLVNYLCYPVILLACVLAGILL